MSLSCVTGDTGDYILIHDNGLDVMYSIGDIKVLGFRMT